MNKKINVIFAIVSSGFVFLYSSITIHEKLEPIIQSYLISFIIAFIMAYYIVSFYNAILITLKIIKIKKPITDPLYLDPIWRSGQYRPDLAEAKNNNH